MCALPKTNNITNLVQRIAIKTGLPEKKVKTILSSFLDITKNSVSKGDKVVLRGFGSFNIKIRKARKYRDIHTGEIRQSAPITVPSFTFSQTVIKTLRECEAKKPSARVSLPIKPVPERKPLTPVVPRVRKPLIEDIPGCETILSSPNPAQTADLRIGYTPSHEFDSSSVYPVVYSPKAGSYLKLPREGRSNIKGFKEEDFLYALQENLSGISISDNFHLKIPGRYSPYEPDIVLFDERINLYIDVEIDEPYDGYSRIVTHTVEGHDAIRDTFFKESGWVVVRFSEKQVHLQCDACIAILKQIIAAMRGEAIPPETPIIERENRWTRIQAIEWEKDLYREKYLGIQFFSKLQRSIRIVCSDEDEGIDQVIERSYNHVAAEDAGQERTHQIGFERRHFFPQAKQPEVPAPKRVDTPLSERLPSKLAFDEETHSYFPPSDLTGNTDHMSVTTLIERFFPTFDQEAYIVKRMQETGMSREQVEKELAEPSERGTDMHKQIEHFLKGEPYDGSSKEFQFFLMFYKEQIEKRGLVFDSAEYAIELKESNIAGTVDALFRKPDGEYVMVDWKRSKHLIIDGYPKKYGFGRGLSVISHLDNSSYYKYELQQSFYKYILEKDYGIKISSMILAVLYPEYDRYYAIKLSEYRKQEVLDMIESYENTL